MPLPTGQAGACTNACTGEAENGPNRADRLAVIAHLLADLSADDRALLAAMLAQGNGAKGGNP